MVLVIVLIISILFTWLGIRKGVYSMGAVLFNLLMSIYVGVLSTPLILKTSPGLEASGYYAAFCIIFLTISCFALLQGICYYFFLRGADILFPDLFDKIAGGVTGFFSGYVLMGFVFLVICMMPFSRVHFLQNYLPWERMESFSARTTAKTCHFIATWSLEYLEHKPERTIQYLVTLGQKDTEEEKNYEMRSAEPSENESDVPASPSSPSPSPPPPPSRTPRDDL